MGGLGVVDRSNTSDAFSEVRLAGRRRPGEFERNSFSEESYYLESRLTTVPLFSDESRRVTRNRIGNISTSDEYRRADLKSKTAGEAAEDGAQVPRRRSGARRVARPPLRRHEDAQGRLDFGEL